MAALLVLVGLVIAFIVHGQAVATDGVLRSTVATADDVGDPPPGTWVVIARHDRILNSPGLPANLSARLAILRLSARPQASLANAAGESGRHFRVATQQRQEGIVQAVLDLSSRREQLSRLLQAMTLAGLCGLAFSALFGVLIGRRAVRPIAEALALQRTFIADASHELRTPLTLLSTRAQLLDRAIVDSGAPAQIVADSRGVVSDVQRLDEVVDDLLVAADPRRQEDHVDVDLGALVSAAVESARAHASAGNVSLAFRDGDRQTPQRIVGAAPALRRAVLALVDNAIDHTPDGGQVCVSTRIERRHIVVSVSDTGPGVPPSAAGELFRRFHSGGRRSGRSHYGLGLALSYDVASRHGGQLRLAKSARGANFELVLPRPGSNRRVWVERMRAVSGNTKKSRAR